MLIANDLPEFLWEYSVMHAAYLRNHSYTQSIPNSTPYTGWHDAKPNVSNLHKFGAPVWILLQGQKEQCKMQPKSKCQVYISFDDGAQAIKYYNPETCKVLTSHNFHNINPPDCPAPPEPIKLATHMPHEGETGGSMLPMGATGSDTSNPSRMK
jgi:hypothetical protein